MKRFVCMLIVLVLFPFCALAVSENDYIGKWIFTEYLKDGTLHFRLLELRSDHSSVIVFGNADGDSTKVPGRSFLGTWSLTSKGVHVIVGVNTTKDLTYKDGFLFEKSSGMADVYSRITSYGDQAAVSDQDPPLESFNDPAFEKALPDGVLIPAGDYIVGVDIPAGDYRADVVSDVGGTITVYPSKRKAEENSLSYINEISLGNMWGTLVFRLTLENGNYVRLKHNSIKLYPYAGLLDLSIPKEK